MKKWIFLMMIASLTMTGCIWIDDDDDGPYYRNLEETIIYINQTPYHIDNYIDQIYAGTVGPYAELYVYGYDFDGTHEYYSQCMDCTLEWGPTYFTLYDGEVFRIYLETTGMSASPAL